MWKNGKNIRKGSWKKSFNLEFYILIILLVITVIVTVINFMCNHIYLFIGGIIIGLVILYIIFKIEKKEKEELEKKKENTLKKTMDKMFSGKRIIEVRFTKNRIYPYYTENFYNDLGSLIFLHMLIYVQEETKFKCYAELCENGILVLYIVTGNKRNSTINKKEFAEIPYELFLEYFELVPVKK